LRTLEDRYRALLAFYPAEHRALHEEEMLGVLLAGARPEQTRPAPVEAFDLIRGALGIRLRRLPTALTATPWRDAAAIAGFLSLVLLLADGLRFLINIPSRFPLFRQENQFNGPVAALGICYETAPFWLLWAVVAVVAFRGTRRNAAIGAAVLTTTQLGLTVYHTAASASPLAWSSVGPSLAGIPLLLAILATAGLALSPGARYGARLLGRVRVTAATAAAVSLAGGLSTPVTERLVGGSPLKVMSAAAAHAWRVHASDVHHGYLVLLYALAIGTVGTLSRSAAGRRACALLAIPAAPLLYSFSRSELNYPDLLRVPGVGLAGFVIVLLGLIAVELPRRLRA
jgi:hypothetical protein